MAGRPLREIVDEGWAAALEPVARIFGTGPWDLDALAGHMERSFGPLLGRQP